MLIPELKNITQIATGSNHVLALDTAGKVFAWGSGQQMQLGHKVSERNNIGLTPHAVGVRGAKFANVACGAYHSFGVDTKGRVWSWGLNSYGEAGIFKEGGGDPEAVIAAPTQVKSLDGQGITDITGGGHHSLAINNKHEVLGWGRVDGSQLGIEIDTLPKEHVIFDERGKARILKNPTAIPSMLFSPSILLDAILFRESED